MAYSNAAISSADSDQKAWQVLSKQDCPGCLSSHSHGTFLIARANSFITAVLSGTERAVVARPKGSRKCLVRGKRRRGGVQGCCGGNYSDNVYEILEEKDCGDARERSVAAAEGGAGTAR